LHYYEKDNRNKITGTISLDMVKQVKKPKGKEGGSIILSTETSDLELRPRNPEESNKWLFGFQQCIIYTSIKNKPKDPTERPRRNTADSFLS